MLCSASPPVRMPHGTMLVEASAVAKLRQPRAWPRPWITPAAGNGIHIICTAQSVSPIGPGSTSSISHMTATLSTGCCASTCRSTRSSGFVAGLLQRRRTPAIGPMQLPTFRQHRAQPMHLRAVRVGRLRGGGVVPAMGGDPFAAHPAGGEPQPGAEEGAGQRMALEPAVRLMAVQQNRHRRDGGVDQGEGPQHHRPPGQGQQAGWKHGRRLAAGRARSARVFQCGGYVAAVCSAAHAGPCGATRAGAAGAEGVP